MNIALRHDDNYYPVLVTCQTQEVDAFEMEGRTSLKDIQKQAEAMSRKFKRHIDKVVINELPNAVELKFFNGHNSKSELVATTTYSYRAKGDKTTIHLKDKDNTPMLTFTEHDEDNKMLRELPPVIDDKKAEDIAVQRDIQIAKARSLPPAREQEKEAYYQDLIRKYEAEKAEQQPRQIKNVPAGSS